MVPIGQPRREQLDAVVVTLHVIERSPPPDVIPSTLGIGILLVGRLGEIRSRRREPGLDWLEPGGNRIGDGDVAALLRQIERQRDTYEIARIERFRWRD